LVVSEQFISEILHFERLLPRLLQQTMS
jgi:hypothetical protein